MEKKQNVRRSGIDGTTSPVPRDGRKDRPLYNYMNGMEAAMDWNKAFGERLAALRMAEGVSAREMSLALGRGPGFVNNIENGHNLPSMAVFFEMCAYLGVGPERFFDRTDPAPLRTDRILENVKKLSPEAAAHLLGLLEELTKEERS